MKRPNTLVAFPFGLFLLTTFGQTARAQQPDFCVNDPYGVGKGQTKPFICSRASDTGGPSLNWPSKKASFKLNQLGSNDIPGTGEFQVLRQGFAAWASVNDAQFDFTDAGMTSSTAVGYDFRHLDDNENLVVFQTAWAHDSSIIGLTTATFNAQTGEIFDADIELNDQNYNFTIGDDSPETDLLNTVTHEAGHFIGFDHADRQGTPIPQNCSEESTMSRVSRIGEVKKRDLAPSDAVGMRYVYPPDPLGVGYCFDPLPGNGKTPNITQTGSSVGGCASAPLAESWLFVVLCAYANRFLGTALNRRRERAKH